MSTLLAVEFGRDTAKFIKARSSARDGVELLDVRELALSDLDEPLTEVSDSGQASEGAATAPEVNAISGADISTAMSRIQAIRDFAHGEEIDATFAVVRSQSVLTESLSLPFHDQKRIDLTAALQLEDLLPFDIDTFVVDSMIVGEQKDGEYDILSALCPRSDVQDLLQKLARVGVQPRAITTRSSALSLLPALAPARFSSTSAILGFHEEGCAVAIVHEGKVRLLRECSIVNGAPNYRSVLRDVRTSIERVIEDHGLQIERISVIGVGADAISALRDALGIDIDLVELRDLCEINPSCNATSPGDLSWACGIFGGFERNDRFLDFRKGDFAYRATLKQLLSSLAGEATYIGWAIALALFWWGSEIYTSRATLAKMERTISTSIAQALPGQVVPHGQERSAIEDKVSELENQLRGLGSLSSLSPLGSLKELSEAINSGLDVNLESLNIGHSRMTFTGSVPDNQAIGRLSGVLEKRADRFCEVKIDPKGKVAGSNRVKFIADLKFCE